MTPLAKLYKRLSVLPAGRWLFSKAVCIKVPYFSTIKPQILVMESGKCVVTMNQRRSVQNHIKTVHAIAVCNLCEIAMGMAAEATIPDGLRWLPKGIHVDYLLKAEGQLTATCEIAPSEFVVGEINLPVEVHNERGELIVKANIPLHITEIPKKKA